MSAVIRSWLIWTAGFLAFPFAGLAGTALAGRIDSPLAALTGGLITGAVIGAAQALCSSRRLDPRRWILASAVGMGAGLLLGASAVGFATSLPDLALMGLLTGLMLGATQAIALPAPLRQRLLWAAATGPLWALGWSVATLAGIDVAQQFSVFGVSGAVTVSALSGALLYRPEQKVRTVNTHHLRRDEISQLSHIMGNGPGSEGPLRSGRGHSPLSSSAPRDPLG